LAGYAAPHQRRSTSIPNTSIERTVGIIIAKAKAPSDPFDDLLQLSDGALLRIVDGKGDASPLELQLAERLRVALDEISELERERASRD
jgi:hypothetical protein